MTDGMRLAVPADVDVPDRVVAGLTFRQLGYLSVAGLGVALLALERRWPGSLVLGPILAAVGLLGAWWRPGGRDLDRWAGPVLRFAGRRPGARRVAALSLPSVAVVAALLLAVLHRPHAVAPPRPPSPGKEVPAGAPDAFCVTVPLGP